MTKPPPWHEAKREMVKPPSGPCVGVDSVHRKCLPLLSPPEYLWPEDCSLTETAPPKIS